eukprot:3740963-Pleurochrysis_carterae.AAC.1
MHAQTAEERERVRRDRAESTQCRAYLLHQADARAQPPQVQVAEIDAVEQQRALLRVVETLEQTSER